jgi:hypothetical protein
MIRKIFEFVQRKRALAQLRDPFRPDWSAWAREPGKKAQFRQALTTEVLNIGFVTENSKFDPAAYESEEALLAKIEASVNEVNELEGFVPYTYEGPDDKPVLPIFSAPCMIQEFTQKSDFLKSGYIAMNAIGQEPPEGLMIAARCFSNGFTVILNPYTKWAYVLEEEDFLWALERVKHQVSEAAAAIE